MLTNGYNLIVKCNVVLFETKGNNHEYSIKIGSGESILRRGRQRKSMRSGNEKRIKSAAFAAIVFVFSVIVGCRVS